MSRVPALLAAPLRRNLPRYSASLARPRSRPGSCLSPRPRPRYTGSTPSRAANCSSASPRSRRGVTLVILAGCALGGALAVPEQHFADSTPSTWSSSFAAKIAWPRHLDVLSRISEEQQQLHHHHQEPQSESPSPGPHDAFFAAMTIPPGRPETLTKEQEEKLKEFWAVTLRVFGVGDSSSGSGSTDAEVVVDDDTPTDSPAESVVVTENGEKKKKKSLGRLLSRKDKKLDKGKEPAAAVVTSPTTNTPVVDIVPDDAANDKYGQTKDFKAAMATQTPEQLRAAFWSMLKCDNPDGLLLRFLRARKWDVQKALVMLVSTMNWRSKEMDVQSVIEKGEAGAVAGGDEGFLKQLRMGKSFLHGLDAEGRPICFVRVKLHRKADQSDESLERYTIYIMETARLMLHAPVDTACVVFNMTDFSLSNMDYNPVKFMIKCFEAHYPESLGVCLVHNAPWAFQTIWAIIRGWLDPVVAGKIHFTRSVDDLAKFIPRSQILREIGGDEDWEYKFVEPIPGEDAALEDKDTLAKLSAEREEHVLEYQRLTREWIHTSKDDDGAAVKARRSEVAKRLRDGYWHMDKYIRARTVYDRTGVIRSTGELDFYGKGKANEKDKGGEKAAALETSADDVD